MVACAIAVACSLLYLPTLGSVPFHPDESSWIYMSRDFDTLVRLRIGDLVWWKGKAPNGDIGFQLLDAPLAKYQIGVARWVSGHRREVIANWDWRRPWDYNQASGAMPSPALLHWARVSSVVAAVLSFVVFFLIAEPIVGILPAAAATLLLAIHPFEPLHARRAMAESAAQLFLMLAMWAIIRLAVSSDADRIRAAVRSAGAGVALGLAVSAKQNAAAIAPLGVVAAVMMPMFWPASISRRLAAAALNTAVLVAASLLTFFVLNPVLYSQPIHAGRDMITMRRNLVQQQVASSDNGGSVDTIHSVPSRLRAAYDEIFWRPPDTNESMTYAELQPSGRAYEKNYLVRFWNVTLARVAFLLLTAMGLVIAILEIVRRRFAADARPLLLVTLWLLAEVAFVALFIPLDWQRYFLPLLPPVCVLAALGASWLMQLLYSPRAGLRGAGRQPAHGSEVGERR
jgi:4-amino-4-deoxy-L-arabinose transferase-like glycosyltransferase